MRDRWSDIRRYYQETEEAKRSTHREVSALSFGRRSCPTTHIFVRHFKSSDVDFEGALGGN